MKRKKNWAWAFLMVLVACSDDNNGGNETPPSGQPPVISEFTIWTGPTLTFQKSPGADPTLAENQDRITDNVWITRGNASGGQIYNAVTEQAADMDLSPEGTLWAKGTTANIENLTFDRFRATLGKPKDNIDVDLVMLLVEDKIALDLKITGWTQQQSGGFIYERSTME
ncbi:MAG: hypothetical protein AAGJ12_11245 [Bacteroidota bacterium]